jgi:hypothetical protein
MTRALRRIKVFGERNCGTTLAQSLLGQSEGLIVLPAGAPMRVQRIAARSGARELVLDLWDSSHRRSTLGWKHAYVDDATAGRLEHRDIAALALVKHPLNWLVSLRRHPYHLLTRPGSPELLHRPIRRERLPRPPASLVDVWRMKTERYLELQDRGLLRLIRFEDFVIDPPASLAESLADIGVETGALAAIPTSVKRDVRTAGEIRDHYAAESWRADALDWDRAEAARIEPELLAALGYRQ